MGYQPVSLQDVSFQRLEWIAFSQLNAEVETLPFDIPQTSSGLISGLVMRNDLWVV